MERKGLNEILREIKFGRSEFEDRWERARKGMGEQDLEAVFVTTEANYRYLSGHATQAWMNRARVRNSSSVCVPQYPIPARSPPTSWYRNGARLPL